MLPRGCRQFYIDQLPILRRQLRKFFFPIDSRYLRVSMKGRTNLLFGIHTLSSLYSENGMAHQFPATKGYRSSCCTSFYLSTSVGSCRLLRQEFLREFGIPYLTHCL